MNNLDRDLPISRNVSIQEFTAYMQQQHLPKYKVNVKRGDHHVNDNGDIEELIL